MKYIFQVQFLFMVLILFSSVFSQDTTDSTEERIITELSPSFRLSDACPQLNDPTSYPENQRWQRVITEAENSVLLRTSDFRTDFSSVDLVPLVQSLKAQGITLVVTQLPPRALVFQNDFLETTAPADYEASKAEAGYREFIAEARAAGALAPNLYDDILRTNTQANYYLARDNHWDYHGIKLTAQSIATLLNEQGFTFETQAYSTNEGYTLKIEGEHTKTVKLICDFYLPYMRSIEPITEVVSETSEEDSALSTSESLFAEQAIDIVLVGTSFSHEVRNFHGYLKEAISTDVLVYQVQGQGVYAAIIEYLSSNNFQEHKPQVIIWEIPANFPITAQKGMDQIIAAANSSACKTSDKVMTNILTVNENQFTLLDTNLAVPQNSEDSEKQTLSLLRIDLPKPPQVVNFKLSYASGEVIPFHIRRSHLTDSTHQVYLPISQEDGNLIGLELTTQTSLTQDFSSDLYLCSSSY